MNNQVVSQYNEYLKLTGGDKIAAAGLTLAAVMMEGHSEAPAQPMTALTVAEAARRLRVSRYTVYEMCKSGRLRSFRPGTGPHCGFPWRPSRSARTKAESGSLPRVPRHHQTLLLATGQEPDATPESKITFGERMVPKARFAWLKPPG